MTETLVPGVMNFRDTGGLPAGPAKTRAGVLYRSGNLAAVSDANALAGLGLRGIVDLRADEEVERDRSLAGDIPITRVPLFLGSVASFFTADVSLDEMYRSMLETSADRIANAVRTIVHVQPVLVHCTVGKDRTGVTVAIALAAAGVDEDAVVDDYARTEGLLPPERNAAVLARLGAMYPQMRNLSELTCKSPAPVMRRLLDHVAAEYGSAADFLRANGISDDEVRGLREVLVESRSVTL